MLKIAVRLDPPALPRNLKVGLAAPGVKESFVPALLPRVPLTTRPSVLKLFTWPRVRAPLAGLLALRPSRTPGAFGFAAVVMLLVFASKSTPLWPELTGSAPTQRVPMLALKVFRPDRSSVARDT